MNNFWRRAKPFILGALCVTLALYFSPLSLTIGYALAIHDVAPIWAKLFSPGLTFIMAVFGMLLAFASFCGAIAAVIEARQKQESLPPLFYYASLFCLIIGVSWSLPLRFRYLWPTRRAGLQQAATRARPLISAIEKFRVENKRAPHNLQELTPVYLPEIPPTGMAAYPRFEYSVGSERTHFQTYQLQIRTSAGFLNWDTFNYWPEGDYPTEMYGGRVERVGAWAYVHE